MPDWKRLIQEHLSMLNLPPDAKEDVIAELAAHLEDSAHAGSEPCNSENPTSTQIPWQKLIRAIERAKTEEGTMNRRTKTFWLPATAVLFATGLILLFLDRAAFLQQLIWTACMVMLIGAVLSEAHRLHPRIRSLWLPAIVNLMLMAVLSFTLDQLNLGEPGIAAGGNLSKAFRTPWLLALPLLGAAGALLAKRGRASRSERLIAGLAPSLVWLAVLILLALVFGLDQRDFSGVQPADLALSALGLVFLPGLALLVGVLPFLRDPKPATAQN